MLYPAKSRCYPTGDHFVAELKLGCEREAIEHDLGPREERHTQRLLSCHHAAHCARHIAGRDLWLGSGLLEDLFAAIGRT
jgi:hypothetical protein